MAYESNTRHSDIVYESVVRNVSAVSALATFCGALFLGSAGYGFATCDQSNAIEYQSQNEVITQQASSSCPSKGTGALIGLGALFFSAAAFTCGRSAVRAQKSLNELNRKP